MMPELSPNTKAILLLTAPLIAGSGQPSSNPLSPGEYKRLARHLRELQRQPADLLLADASELVRACQPAIDAERLLRLLGRGFLLSQVIERWQARAIWVVSRADAAYPRRLKVRLREDAPAVLYGCGDIGLLDTGGLAVVGSRHVDDVLIDYTMAVGQLAADAGRSIISGGAKGIDQAAMRGALEAGGRVTGVLADSLEKTVMNREHRNLLLDGQLVLISPYDPSAGFHVGHAMQRNKLIYALADAALVVSSDVDKGGTWNGATEQLDKLQFVPVYVRSTGVKSAGLEALRERGAMAWPNPQGTAALDAIFDGVAPGMQTPAQAASTLLINDEQPEDVPYAADRHTKEHPALPPADQESMVATITTATHAEPSPADTLFFAVSNVIQHLLKAPMKDAEIATALDVSNAQAKAWLQRLLDDGVIEKQRKPAGYVVKPERLFE